MLAQTRPATSGLRGTEEPQTEKPRSAAAACSPRTEEPRSLSPGIQVSPRKAFFLHRYSSRLFAIPFPGGFNAHHLSHRPNSCRMRPWWRTSSPPRGHSSFQEFRRSQRKKSFGLQRWLQLVLSDDDAYRRRHPRTRSSSSSCLVLCMFVQDTVKPLPPSEAKVIKRAAAT
jgi:hypothetical protein